MAKLNRDQIQVWLRSNAGKRLHKAHSCAAGQEVTRLSWDPSVHCRVNKSPPLGNLPSILLSHHPLLNLPTFLFPSAFQPKFRTQFSPPHSCYMISPSNVPWFVKEYKLDVSKVQQHVNYLGPCGMPSSWKQRDRQTNIDEPITCCPLRLESRTLKDAKIKTLPIVLCRSVIPNKGHRLKARNVLAS